MGRTQRALTSLVAAIPAGFLAYLLVDVFLKRADTLPTMVKVLVGVTLLCAALVALMPFGLLIFGGARKSADDVGKTAASRKGAKADDDDEVEAVEEVEEADDDSVSAFDDDDSVSAFDDESDADADIMADSDDDLTSGPPSSMDEIESVDFEDEEEEEKPAPKKRKK